MQGQATVTSTAAWCPQGASPWHGSSVAVPAGSIAISLLCEQLTDSSQGTGQGHASLAPSPAPRHSRQPSGQFFRRLHWCITEGCHLLSHSLPDLNTERQEDEHFRFKSFAISSQLSYCFQLHTRSRSEGCGAAKALAIPTNILQPMLVSGGRTVAVLENSSCAHHPTSKVNQALPPRAEGSAHQGQGYSF